MTTAERRLEPREGSLMVVNFSFDGKAYTEFTRNISNRGICVESAAKIPVGQDLTLLVHPPRERPIKLHGKVMWMDSEQIGFRLQ